MFFHKIKEHESYLAIQSIMSSNYDITHIKEHQDDHKPKEDLITEEKLNMDTEKIVTTCAKLPLNIHLPTSPLAFYVKGNYIHLPSHKRMQEVFNAKNILQQTFMEYSHHSRYRLVNSFDTKQ